MVVEHMQAPLIKEQTVVLIAQPSIVGPAVPQARDHIEKLMGTPVTLVVLHMLGHPEVERRIGVGGGDDVPAGAPATDVIERREAPRDVIRLIEGGRRGGYEPDAFGDHRQA